MKEQLNRCTGVYDDDIYPRLGNDGELYTEKVLKAFYPDLSPQTIDKIENGEYYVKQFGITIEDKYRDNGKDCILTGRGNINEGGCFSIPPNSTWDESYNLKSDAIHCGKHIFDRDTHIIISKARREHHDETINKNLPIVEISQSQPLVIADAHNDELIKYNYLGGFSLYVHGYHPNDPEIL